MSKGEEQIAKILYNEDFYYIREKRLGNYRNCRMRFDFVVYTDTDIIAIEVNGMQHYEYTSKFFKTQAEFKHAQVNDSLKISYCLANEIKMYCIPYWELKNIKTSKDIFQDKFLAKDRFHNYNVYREYKNSSKERQ